MYEKKTNLLDKPFIREIESFNEEKRKSLYLRYCKSILTNFSLLYIKKIWKEEQLLKYSYYWVSANNTLIHGWDNAPHHNSINCFPHHIHTEEGIFPSNERNLLDVIKYIEKIFIS